MHHAEGRVVRARELLRETFGHPEFRPGQEELVDAMLRDRDVLAILPTGAGKSICYQVPALSRTGTTLVVSPLIALMQDQVDALRRAGVETAAWNSTVGVRERGEIARRLRDPRPYLLYVSPEGLRSARFRAALSVAPVRVVVDEAHCISEWGHDFRPLYRQIPVFLADVGRPPVAAFTATATAATRADLERLLALRRPFRAISSVDRRNLWFGAIRAGSLDRALAATGRALDRAFRQAALVYVQTRAAAVGAASVLRRLGYVATAYHAGLPADWRREAQERWLGGEVPVMCATSAFGMGIDHPRVRRVIHLGMPAALESYVQEAGRAGRDGAPAACTLIELPGDRKLHSRRIREQPRRSRRRSKTRLDAIVGYVRTARCRRAWIARYFGEPSPTCSRCDRCGAARPPARTTGAAPDPEDRQPRGGCHASLV